METKTWVLATILFSGAFAMLVVMMVDATTEYNMAGIIDENLQQRYNKIADSSSLVDTLSKSVKDEGGLSLIGGIRSLFSATVGVVNAVFNSLALLPTVTASIGEDFAIPSAVTNTFFVVLVLLVTVTIIFAILNAGSGGRV